MDSNMPMTVKLEDGTYADIRINRVITKELLWSDQKEKTPYLISFIVTEKTNNPWTKEDMIKITESME
ncbi:hypothetical protein [Bacillus sp. NEB1478]|uniref:hypothetical protein n=1 Tax=Bacillus sp. NEB1478 TaxID=3073816 RepID=UPI0028739150|nr:hypothetical protein [Bacillus sp. NEB1478]WNB91262.1 hypothetical protein RGB74_15325 [Bacillus sp. NEB1478]